MILISTVSGYLVASTIQSLNLFGKLNFLRAVIRPLSFVILLCHGLLLYRLIEIDAGQNLDAILMLSMILWLMGLIVFATFNQALNKLNCIVYVLAGATLPIAFTQHGEYVVAVTQPLMLFHILISFMAVSVLLLAFFQAITLSVQNRLLKRNLNHPILKALPPLMQMEHLLFTILGVGFVLLTLSLASGLAFPEQLLSEQNLPKTVLATVAWCMFLGILSARKGWGLRGASARRLTLFSGALIFLSYFGTQLMMT